jgi:2-succinyl-5-enolpyruvyl-6-hydroxy-3-cyclohexene-1-carboxylate synthase
MRTSGKQHIAFLSDYLVSNGIEDVIISPGSRNAPMIIAFEGHPKIKTHLIHDERVAAFYALGMSDASSKPVALVCTSGTALLNYSPAIAEAYYRQVPLLVLSADRPQELVDQGDGQTIRQFDVYHNFIVSSHTYKDVNDNAQVLENALKNLFNEPKGPVHINIPLAEPLYDVVEHELSSTDKFEISTIPSIETISNLNELKNIWKSAEKKLLIVGQHNPDPRLEKVIDNLANDPSVAILVENTSNILQFTRACHNIDRTLATIAEEELDNYSPDLLVAIGGAVISKRIKAYFRKQKANHTWRVGLHLIEEDTYQSLTETIAVNPSDFLDEMIALEIEIGSNYGSKWKQKDFLAQAAHDDFIQTAPYSDLKVFGHIMDFLPDETILHMGNSSVVRYCQLFNPIKSVRYFSNRGVSGIDGSTSTAGGYALKTPNQLNVLISGDISFFYDSNAFWNHQLKGNFKVIVISNGGGGIFEIIPGPKSTHQAKTFFAPTVASVKGICNAYDVNYLGVSNETDLLQVLPDFFKNGENDRPTVLEIDTRSCPNSDILTAYFEYIGQQVR